MDDTSRDLDMEGWGTKKLNHYLYIVLINCKITVIISAENLGLFNVFNVIYFEYTIKTFSPTQSRSLINLDNFQSTSCQDEFQRQISGQLDAQCGNPIYAVYLVYLQA